MGYITGINVPMNRINCVSKLFRAYGLYNDVKSLDKYLTNKVSKLFRAYGLYNRNMKGKI